MLLYPLHIIDRDLRQALPMQFCLLLQKMFSLTSVLCPGHRRDEALFHHVCLPYSSVYFQIYQIRVLNLCLKSMPYLQWKWAQCELCSLEMKRQKTTCFQLSHAQAYKLLFLKRDLKKMSFQSNFNNQSDVIVLHKYTPHTVSLFRSHRGLFCLSERDGKSAFMTQIYFPTTIC